MRTPVWLSYSYPIQSTKANYYIPYATRSRYRSHDTPQKAIGAPTPTEWLSRTMSHVQQHAREPSKAIGSDTSNTVDSEWLDECFALLSNSRRRHAIQVMLEHERMDFGELVDRVAELEYGLPIEEISGDERHTIYVSLSQSHKPRLEKAGVVESERDTGTITLGPKADEMKRFLAEADVYSGKESFRDKVAGLF